MTVEQQTTSSGHFEDDMSPFEELGRLYILLVLHKSWKIHLKKLHHQELHVKIYIVSRTVKL